MLRRTSLKLGTPWAVSLGIHIALVGLLTLVAVRAAMEPSRGPERYIDFDDPAPEAALTDAPPRPVAQDVPAPKAAVPAAPASVEGLTERAATPTRETPDERQDVEDAWLAPTSISAAPAAPDPARLNALAIPAAPKGGEVRFAGLGSSNARSVVYVVDASGPMVSSLREVIDELDRSVSRLSATQRFGVIVFRRVAGARETESFMPVLVRATPKAKEELRAWLKGVAPAGVSNPLSGLRAALEMRPDAVFLLSRGIERSGGGIWELGLTATMDELDRLNPATGSDGRRDVVIKTIQFLDEDPTGTMQRIGQIHGHGSAAGKTQAGYRVVKRGSELKDEPAGGLEP